MDYTIAPMNWSHVPDVAALEKQCFTDAWSERSIGGELENPLSLWLVALSGCKVIGYIGCQAVLDEADVMNVAVDPEARGYGIGKMLLRALVSRLRDQRIVALSLEVRPSNVPAVSLYRREGFQKVGQRKKYYVNPSEDALILRKEWEV